MIKKFFFQIIIITIIICFFGLNFETKVDVRFWFNDKMTFEGISLFIALASAYGLGLLTSIPFYIARGLKKKKNSKIVKKETSIKSDE